MKRALVLSVLSVALAAPSFAQVQKRDFNITTDCRQEISTCNISGNESALRTCLERRAKDLSPTCLVSMQKLGWKPQR